MSERSWSFSDSMAEATEKAGGAVELTRDLGIAKFTKVPDEITNWIEEQRSWRESVAFADQSYHMTDLYVEGPEALELFKDYAVNTFANTEPGKAKQLVVANPNGKFIGDAIWFHLEEDKFLSVGGAAAHNWLQYQGETGDYDLEVDMQPRPVTMKEDPTYYRYQVQGPNAYDLMEEVADEPLPELGFFNHTTISIEGHDVNILRHGMAGEAGYEFWGPYEESDEIKDIFMSAGQDYDIRALGAESYQTPNAILGWIPIVVPAVWDEGMEDYLEWLDVGDGLLSIGGSFNSDDITDYYFTPTELGYGHIINFDHEFCGSEALEAEAGNPDRQKVTLVWDDDDVVDIFASLFTDGPTKKFMRFPHPRASACHYDEVLVDGEPIGFSTDKSYIYNQREFLSLGVIDSDYVEPGTEVTIRWGEPEDNTNSRVERHEMAEVTATVAPAPYTEDSR